MRYKSPLANLLALHALTAMAQATDPDVISMPIRYLFGGLSKITTSVMVGSGNQAIGQSIEVVVDYGSSAFWVFGPNATVNYGSKYLGTQGQCNTSPPTYYHPTTASLTPFHLAYSYGGNSKILYATSLVNDTLAFPPDLPGPPIRDVPVALVTSGTVRQYVSDGTPCPDLAYDMGIMGLAPASPGDSDPSILSHLLARARIPHDQVSMYFAAPPAHAPTTHTFTGTVLFGALPPRDSYTGDRVAVPLVRLGGNAGYLIATPAISHRGAIIPADYPAKTCLVDSGSLAITLPYAPDDADFFRRTGLQSYQSMVVYPGECEEIPRDLTLDFAFAGLTLKVPYWYMARTATGPGGVAPKGLCILSGLKLGTECVLGAPWFLGTSLAVDGAAGVVWIAQGNL